MIRLTDILKESVSNGVVICDKCGWHWNISDGGEDTYTCHKCGNDNTPINEDFEIPSGKWVDYDLSKIPQEGMENIWDMYSTAYIKANLDLSASGWRELQSKYKAVALLDVDKDHIPDAFIIYKVTPFGNKMALLGTNNKKDAKSQVVKQAIKLTKTSGWFIEASAKMEDIMKSSGAPVVRDEKKILAILGNEKAPEFVGDGYYTRALSKVNKRIVKRIYGKPK